MKILIPENCILWTTKGFCFPKDLIYGTEIFTIDPENKLVTTPITEDVEEPEPMKVQTIFTQNNISTLIPHYKIQVEHELIPAKQIQKEQSIELMFDIFGEKSLSLAEKLETNSIKISIRVSSPVPLKSK